MVNCFYLGPIIATADGAIQFASVKTAYTIAVLNRKWPVQSWAEPASIRQRIYRSTLSVIGCRLADKIGLVTLSLSSSQVWNRQCWIIDERNIKALLVYRCRSLGGKFVANNAPIPYFYYFCPKEDCECEKGACSLLFPYIFLCFGCRLSGVGVDCRLCLSVVVVSCWLSCVGCWVLTGDCRAGGHKEMSSVSWLTNRL